MNRIIQNRVTPAVPVVEFDAGDGDVDDGREVEKDQQSQGSKQACLRETQVLNIVAEFCLGKCQSNCEIV